MYALRANERNTSQGPGNYVTGAVTGTVGQLDDQDTRRLVTHALTSEGHDASEDGTGRGTPLVAAPLSHGSNPNSNAAGRRREDDENLVHGFYPTGGTHGLHAESDVSPPVKVGSGVGIPSAPAVAYHFRTRENGSCIEEGEVHVSRASVGGTGGAKLAIQTPMTVRRLTPVECCRLQGFPDDWFGEPNEPPDSPKYAALGDAVTVNVAHWLGKRLLDSDRREGVA